MSGSQWRALSAPTQIGLKKFVKFKGYSCYVRINQNGRSSAVQKYPGFYIFRPFNTDYNHFKKLKSKENTLYVLSQKHSNYPKNTLMGTINTQLMTDVVYT